MTPMALMLAIAAPAMAGPRAHLEVDNDFDGELELYVNGRFEGLVPGDERLRVPVKTGRRDIRLQRPGGGATLLAQSLHFSPNVISIVRVKAPMTTLQVRNTSVVPLQVDVGPGDGIWIAPSTAIELQVRAGTVGLEARARLPGGVEQVSARKLWAEPGQRSTHVLDYKPPITRLALKNRDHQRLRAVVGDVVVGWLDPGESQVVTVDPGRLTVRFYDRHGRLVSVMDARATRGEKTPVVATRAAVPPPPPAHQRPGSCDGRPRDDRYALR